MDPNFVYILLGCVIAYAFYSSRQVRRARRLDVEEKLERLGLELVDISVGTNGTRGNTYYTFRFTARRPGEEATHDGFGRFEVGGDRPHVEWCDVNPSKNRSWFPDQTTYDRFNAPSAPRISQDVDAQIRREVSARLDAIAKTPGAMLEHDMDGSGHVDALEWEALRAKIRAEVEAERGIAAIPNITPLSDKPPGSW